MLRVGEKGGGRRKKALLGSPIDSPPPFPSTTRSGTQKKGSPPNASDGSVNLTKMGESQQQASHPAQRRLGRLE